MRIELDRSVTPAVVAIQLCVRCVLGGQIQADADDVALGGGSQEEEGKARASNEEVRGGRLAAARAWWKYKQAGHLQATAERELQKVSPDDDGLLSACALRTVASSPARGLGARPITFVGSHRSLHCLFLRVHVTILIPRWRDARFIFSGNPKYTADASRHRH